MSGCCSDDTLSALVDGALSHDERDRAHAHLARCDRCRGEVEALRGLKARLSGLAAATPPPPPGLEAALRALAGPAPDAPSRPPAPPVLVGVRRPVTRHPRRHHRLRRSTAVGGVLALGLGAVLLLAGSADAPATTPVDPGTDAFVVDFASTTGGVPAVRPVVATAVPAPVGR